MRLQRPSSLASLFALLSLACAAASCGIDSGENKESAATHRSTSPQTSRSAPPAMPWTPDTAVVLIPDIAGYFRDCNCSGVNIGGLERVPHAANDSPDLHYFFYGDTLFPSRGRAAGANLGKAAVERMVSSTATLWSQLGNVNWCPSPAELETLRYHDIDTRPLLPFMVSDLATRMDGVKVRVEESAPTMTLEIGEGAHVATAPTRGAKGREIAVVGLWRTIPSDQGRVEADGPPLLSRTLGTVAMHRPRENSPTWRIMFKELAKGGVLLSSWRAFLPASMPKSAEIGRFLDAHEVRLAHGVPGKTVDTGEFLARMREQVESCKGCHARAVETWMGSPHAKAWLTLKSKMQHNNPSCLSCHVEKPTTFENAGGMPRADHFRRAAVTCNTCHTSDEKPTLRTCEGCHNEHTDPKGLYRTHFTDICPGDKPYSQENTKCPLR
jgi:hypothetical protein